MFSIYINWHEELSKNYDNWHNEGQRVIREILENSEHENYKEVLDYFGFDIEDLPEYPEDTIYNYFIPLMNYGYPLEIKPDDDRIYKVVMGTNLTVMYNYDMDNYYLALTGGGMDLSQDIGLAYLYTDNYIPFDLANRIYIDKELTVHGKDFIFLLKGIKDSLENDIHKGQGQLKKINNILKDKRVMV